jgi:hypothetical protein
MTKFILVCGGVVSGIGKGIIASSTGLLLKTTGLNVTAIKIDPYMNIDAGTMRPTEHGARQHNKKLPLHVLRHPALQAKSMFLMTEER